MCEVRFKTLATVAKSKQILLAFGYVANHANG